MFGFLCGSMGVGVWWWFYGNIAGSGFYCIHTTSFVFWSGLDVCGFAVVWPSRLWYFFNR